MADHRPTRFRVVEGGEQKKSFARSHAAGTEQIVCRQCERDIGVLTSHAIQTVAAPMEKNGEMIGGTAQLICVSCLSRGNVTVLL